MKSTTICTWFYAEKKGEESNYPQVNISSSSYKFQEIYWKCIITFFKTSLQFNKECSHEFFTNIDIKNLPIIDGFSVKEFLESNNIKITNKDLTYKTPEGYFGSWRNQFYIFDILKEINNRSEEVSNYIILDSDCIWLKKLDEKFIEMIDEKELLTYKIPYDDEHIINGLSRLDMKEIYEELENKKLDKNPNYYGGEVFAGNTKAIKKICDLNDDIWEKMIERYKKNKKKFNEEAHLLSYIYYKLGYESDELSTYIRRIWTYPFHYNSNKEDLKLTILHMPSEKKYGFNYMFNGILKDKIKFDSPKEYTTWCINNFGISKRNIYKNIKDIIMYLKNRIIN